jgi:hypothetical protein
MAEKIMSMLSTLFFTCIAFLGLGEFEHAIQSPVYGSRYLPPNACLIIAMFSVALFPRFAQNLVLLFRRIHREIASGQIHDS